MRYLSLCLALSSLFTTVAFAENAPLAPASASDRTLWVCNARSILGKRFSATGTDKVLAQEEAMQKCEAYAFRCYRTGCDATEGR